MSYPYKLPDLPYAEDALEPYIDARTMGIHHGKHHAAYVANLNTIAKTNPQLGSSKITETWISRSIESLIPRPQRRAFLPDPFGEAIQRGRRAQPITLVGSVAARASAAAIRVRSIAISSWARETNQASNWEGGSQMPRSSMAR